MNMNNVMRWEPRRTEDPTPFLPESPPPLFINNLWNVAPPNTPLLLILYQTVTITKLIKKIPMNFRMQFFYPQLLSGSMGPVSHYRWCMCAMMKVHNNTKGLQPPSSPPPSPLQKENSTLKEKNRRNLILPTLQTLRINRIASVANQTTGSTAPSTNDRRRPEKRHARHHWKYVELLMRNESAPHQGIRRNDHEHQESKEKNEMLGRANGLCTALKKII